MQNNNIENIKDKQIFRTSLFTQDELFEMVYNPITNKSSYFKYDRHGELGCFIDEVEIDGRKFRPLPPDHALVEKKVILFPTQATPYENEEELLKEIQTFLHKYLDITPTFEQIATYYIPFTWLYDRFNELPYLRAIGDFGSGKSRFLQAIGILCYKPIFTGGATTPSPIFRIVNEVKGTLIIDEADFKFSDMTADIIKILNTGYQKGMPVLRSEGKGVFEVKAYDVFCPKIVATRETFSDKALESRFLVEEMGVSKLRTGIPRTLDDNFYYEAECIRNKLLMWRFKNYFQPIERQEDIIEGVHPRLSQIVIPLFSIIKEPAIRERLKNFIIQYNGELVADRGLSRESDITFAILKFEHDTGKKEATVGEIAGYVNEDIFDFDDKLTPKKIGWFLRSKMQLKPYKTRRGFVLNLEQNRTKLNFWKERYGISDADINGEQVNDVNIAEDNGSQEIKTDELLF